MPPTLNVFFYHKKLHRLDFRCLGEQKWTSSSLSLWLLHSAYFPWIQGNLHRIRYPLKSLLTPIHFGRNIARADNLLFYFFYRFKASITFLHPPLVKGWQQLFLADFQSLCIFAFRVAVLPSSVCQEGASDQSADQLNIQKAPPSSSHLQGKSISHISTSFIHIEGRGGREGACLCTWNLFLSPWQFDVTALSDF